MTHKAPRLEMQTMPTHNQTGTSEGSLKVDSLTGTETNGRQWHAIFCKPRQDGLAEQQLLNQGFEIFRPKTRQPARRRKGRVPNATQSLFPRYLFVRLHQSAEDWSPIRSTRGVVGLVHMGGHTPIVPESVIKLLRDRCDADGIMDLKGQIGYQPGDTVEIIDGPCAGYRALFEARSGAERVVVLLNILQHQRRVELSEISIQPA